MMKILRILYIPFAASCRRLAEQWSLYAIKTCQYTFSYSSLPEIQICMTMKTAYLLMIKY